MHKLLLLVIYIPVIFGWTVAQGQLPSTEPNCEEISAKYTNSVDSCWYDQEKGQTFGEYKVHGMLWCKTKTGCAIDSDFILDVPCDGGTPTGYEGLTSTVFETPSLCGNSTDLDPKMTDLQNVAENRLLSLEFAKPVAALRKSDHDDPDDPNDPGPTLTTHDDQIVFANLKIDKSDAISKGLAGASFDSFLKPTLESFESPSQCYPCGNGTDVHGTNIQSLSFVFPDPNGCHTVFDASLEYECNGGKAITHQVKSAKYDPQRDPSCKGKPPSHLLDARQKISESNLLRFSKVYITEQVRCYQPREQGPGEDLQYTCPPFDVGSAFSLELNAPPKRKKESPGSKEGYGYSSAIFDEKGRGFAITKIVSSHSETHADYSVELPFFGSKIVVERSIVSHTGGEGPTIKALDLARTNIPKSGQIFSDVQYAVVLKTLGDCATAGVIQPVEEPDRHGVYDCTMNQGGSSFVFTVTDVALDKNNHVAAQKITPLQILCSFKNGLITNIYPIKAGVQQ